jgi:multimeric flavodoxin WrbA
MYVVAFNGSPRRDGNTAVLLRKALEGAASRGAETELVHLGQVTMKGCQACYSCKRRGGASFGRCMQADGMTPLYAKMERADGILLGAPIYFGTISSEAKAFLERLFPYFNYGGGPSRFPGKVKVGLIVTAGADEQVVEKVFRQHIQLTQMMLQVLLGPAEALTSSDTLHVEDYSEIVADALQPLVPRKLEHRQTVFPADCRKAFEMGARFAGA